MRQTSGGNIDGCELHSPLPVPECRSVREAPAARSEGRSCRPRRHGQRGRPVGLNSATKRKPAPLDQTATTRKRWKPLQKGDDWRATGARRTRLPARRPVLLGTGYPGLENVTMVTV